MPKVKCGPTKLSYIITFGLGPYFKMLVMEELQEVPCFVVSSDESLNQELQQEQLDFIVKYFKEGKVTCGYLTPIFMCTHE